MDLESATEGFVRSFCRMKSRTYPYVPTQVSGLWILRDDPPRKNERKIEVVSDLEPRETTEVIRDAGLGWHFIVSVSSDDAGGQDEIRLTYKELGYRALSTEWMFANGSADVPFFESEPAVRLIESQAEIETIPQSAGQPRKLMPGSRQYAIWDETRDYGWVMSMPEDEVAWAYDLYVFNGFRGRGYGRALMSRILRDDRAAGFKTSALIASTAGARLYPHLGYRQIGTLQIFCPVKR